MGGRLSQSKLQGEANQRATCAMVETVQQLATAQLKRDSRNSIRKTQEKQIIDALELVPTLGHSGDGTCSVVRDQREFIANIRLHLSHLFPHPELRNKLTADPSICSDPIKPPVKSHLTAQGHHVALSALQAAIGSLSRVDHQKTPEMSYSR